MEIQNKVLLSKLTISQFNPKKADTQTTNEVLREKQASRNAGMWVKYLVNPDNLLSVTSYAQKARLEHYKLSLPWEDEGWRILPVKMYTKYQDKMIKCKDRFNMEVEKFVTEWPECVEEAKIALKDMFNIQDYPSTDQIRSKFDFRILFLPLPSKEDFRISLSQEEMEERKKDVDNLIKVAEETAMKDLWSRLSSPIKNMVDKLSDSDSIFRNSLIENLREVLDLVPNLNISDNTELDLIIKECKDKLTIYSPEVLRENSRIRKTVALQAEELLNRMKGYI